MQAYRPAFPNMMLSIANMVICFEIAKNRDKKRASVSQRLPF